MRFGEGVTRWPQAADGAAGTKANVSPAEAKPRSAVSTLVPFAVAAAGAVLMALAFPKTNLAPLAPLGAAALFWTWFGLRPGRALLVGWLAGSVFFTINYAWFGETAGALIAPFGFLLTLGPAIGDGFFGFGLAGALTAYAVRCAPRPLVPLAAAAAFGFCEWLRAEGLGQLGVPFGSLAYTQAAGPLAPLAAFVGCYGLTFVICVPAAYAAYALRFRETPEAWRDALSAFAAVAAATLLAWIFWPARTLAAPAFGVAAVQGDIKQDVKFAPGSFALARERYERLSLEAGASHPRLIVWPETVIPVALNRMPWLQAQFAQLARALDAELAVGTLESAPAGDYNVLYFFNARGTLDGVYRKRQLVPFAEHLPFAALLGWIPWTQNISHFESGEGDGLVAVDGQRFAPIVCWESAFSGLVRRDARDGASALLVATDDAWFGTTAGPYQHAQIAQMRAIETGRWVVRAASTGISGIIAPDGRYTARSQLDEQTVVAGSIGAPVPTLYDELGPGAIALGLALLYAAPVAWRRLRRA
ncbi:MAG: apolipoprotein N-acyltransferase [Candidatus Baltobacteraceae bacterium]